VALIPVGSSWEKGPVIPILTGPGFTAASEFDLTFPAAKRVSPDIAPLIPFERAALRVSNVAHTNDGTAHDL